MKRASIVLFITILLLSVGIWNSETVNNVTWTKDPGTN